MGKLAYLNFGFNLLNLIKQGGTVIMSIKKLILSAMPICAAVAVAAFAQPAGWVDPCTQNTALTGGTSVSLSSGNNQATGTIFGSGDTRIHYEVWVDAGGAEGANLKYYGENQGGGAAFYASWTNPDDYLGRVGYYWGNGKTYTNYKNMYCDFNYTKTGTGGSYSYIGIYGWARNPSASQANRQLIEYYIIDDWYGSGQMQASNTGSGCNTSYDSYTMDGGTYKVHTCVRDQKPSIDGTKTFTQYFAIRQGMGGSSSRTCGTYSITEHFKKWESMGLTLGNMYEAKFLAEAGGGTGTFDASYIKFSQEDVPRGSVTQGNFSLITTASPTTGGEITRSATPAGGYAPGSTVTLTATAKSGWTFVKWEGDHTGTTSPATITMNANKNITAIFEPAADGTTNMVKSGNFPSSSVVSTDDGADWKVGQGQYWGNSQASASVSNGSVTVNISTVGAEPYQPQLVQYGIPLDKGMNYRLTFTASAAAAREITVGFQQSSDPWATYASKDFNLTTSSQDFTMEFKMDSTSDAAAQLAFNLGKTTDNVTISNVKLIYIASSGNTSVAARPAVSPAATSPNIKVTAGKAGINVKFKAANSGATELKLYSLKGDLVAKASLQTAAGKSYRHTFSPGKLANGFYVVSVSSSGAVERSKVIMPK
jgi:uncharacterized repeat protein (TIGR02543 family)